MTSYAPTIPSKSTTFLPAPPAAAQFSPLDPTLLVVGTYTLDTSLPDQPKKSGTLELYRISRSTSSSDPPRHIQSQPTSGGAILDLRFSPHRPELLALAQSAGTISLYRLSLPSSSSSASPALRLVRTHELFPPDATLPLSLSWHPGRAGDKAAVTLSTGAVAIVHLPPPTTTTDDAAHVVAEFPAHAGLEVWCCEWGAGGGLYTGGDDGTLVGWDAEAGVALFGSPAEEGRRRLVGGRQPFGAGVTAVMEVSPGGVLATGSYDERLRVVDTRAGRVKVVEELGLGGGVWRLQGRGRGGDGILASCMHAGSRVLDVRNCGKGWQDGEDGALSVVARWEENESMNYASHVHPDAPNIIASTSFYDKRLSIWSI